MKKLFLLLAIATSASFAEPIYKCTAESGKVLYSNEPCVGAQRIDATASKGFDKSSGRVMKGQSVRKEEADQMIERSVQITLGKEWNLEKTRKRQFHRMDDRAKCELLDYQIDSLEKREKANKGKPELQDVQVELFEKRKAFREIDC
jgi:hypothetical protein